MPDTMIKCEKCNHENELENKFCYKCGAPLPKKNIGKKEEIEDISRNSKPMSQEEVNEEDRKAEKSLLYECERCGKKSKDVKMVTLPSGGTQLLCPDCSYLIFEEEKKKQEREIRYGDLILKTNMLWDESYFIMSLLEPVEDEKKQEGEYTTFDVKPKDFYAKVEEIIRKNELPVQSEVRPTRWEVPFEEYGEVGSEQLLRTYLPGHWYKQFRERRSKLVISLKGHFYSFLKFVIGMDKLGKFVQIKTQLLQDMPPEPIRMPQKRRVAAPSTSALVAVMIVLGLLLGFTGMAIIFGSPGNWTNGILVGIFGLGLIIFGIRKGQSEREKYEKNKRQAEWEYQENLRRVQEKERLKGALKNILHHTRGYKDDDLTILCHSIQKVVNTAIRQLFIETEKAKIERQNFGQKNLFAEKEDSGFGGL